MLRAVRPIGMDGMTYAMTRCMTKNALLVRDKNGDYQKPRPFAEEDHPLFQPTIIRFRMVDGVLVVLFLGMFMGMISLLAK